MLTYSNVFDVLLVLAAWLVVMLIAYRYFRGEL